MKRRLTTMLLLAVLCPAGLAYAQDPQSPQGEEDTPTFTTDDVAPPNPTILTPTVEGLSAGAFWDQFYAELARKGATPEEIEQVRARIDGGQELAFGVRFDVGSDGRIVNFASEQVPGVAALDRLATPDVAGTPTLLPLAGFRGVRFQLYLSKVTLRVHATGTAPTTDLAMQMEAAMQRIRTAQPAGGFRGLENVSLTRQGASLELSVTLPMATLTGGR